MKASRVIGVSLAGLVAALALVHLPGLRSPAAYGAPIAVKYRAARRSDGIVFIGYHFIWEREENPAPGLGPALSRALYTGGLSLQRLMFGKGDVELVIVELEADDRALAPWELKPAP